ncbi:hypothetical protein HPB50_027203 [Hyalomma asiaticum]|uniref:Uncharacterized protein n=1 Tax=Hyalomma asiaticum TaxID=266040 RepID=A0ACB7TMZ4_HYAAI|nr:hypothetical protein HPB50_027203 [Hyalomma asiaticum]
MRVSVGPERLLGACLIAKPPRPAWAGVPLIALPPSPPLDEQIVSLSQLALHAQGSPLVLAPRGRKPLAAAEEPTPPSTPDSALATDEAQAPLPRVLKPRKRRKRERAASAPGGPGPPSALCACALCCRAAAYPTPPVSPLRDWDDFRSAASRADLGMRGLDVCQCAVDPETRLQRTNRIRGPAPIRTRSRARPALNQITRRSADLDDVCPVQIAERISLQSGATRPSTVSFTRGATRWGRSPAYPCLSP